MKSVFRIMMIATLLTLTFSCTKDDVNDGDPNCYVCSVEAESLDVCITEDGDFLVDGETVANPNKATLEEYIRAIEANPNDDPALEGISCKKN